MKDESGKRKDESGKRKDERGKWKDERGKVKTKDEVETEVEAKIEEL